MNDRLIQGLLFLARWRVAGVGLLLSVVFVLFGYHYMQDTTSFNSDHLYCIHFCDDVLHGRDLRGWHLPAAPYVFPDMLLVLVSSAITSNLTAEFVLYGLMYYGLLLAALMAVIRGLGLSWRDAFTIGGLGVSFLLAAHFDPVYVNRSLPMFHPGNHMGCLLAGFAAIAYVLRGVRNGYGWLSAGLFVALCVLSGFSDQLLIVQFFAPLCMAAVLLGLCRLISFRRALVTVGLLGVSTILAMRMRIVLVKLGFVPMRITNLDSELPTDVIGGLGQAVANVWDIVHDQPLMCIAFILNLVAILAVLVVWFFRARQPADVAATPPRLDRTSILMLALVLLLAPWCNAGAMIVTHTVEEAALLRYLHTWYFTPFLCLVLWARLLPWRMVRLVPWAVVVFVAFRLFTFPDSLSADHFAHRYPPLAQALDELSRKHGRLRGFAEYWRAREMRYLTQEHVPVAPILSTGTPWFHGFNPNSFLSDDLRDISVPDYHFVVMSTEPKAGDPNPEQMLARYGKPVEIISAGKYDIWRYDRMVSRQLDLFLRAQVAQRLVDNKPFLTPAEPAALRKPKRNLTLWNAPGNLHLKRGESLTIRFDKPIMGAMIDISAHFWDEYTLLFLRDGKELGTTRVPSVDWTGAEIAYGKPGLQSRLVPVPPACRAEGFNEVRVTPTGRPPQFVLGHFLVFDEWIPYQSGGARQFERYHRYEGEKMSALDSAYVTMVEESAASKGQARQASSSFQNCMAFGPYTLLAPGRYRIDFALKVEDNTFADTVATIDSCAFGGQQLLESRPLRGTDFDAPDRYKLFSLRLDAEDELDLVEFRVHTHGKTTVTLDYVDITRIEPAKTSAGR